MRLGDLDCLLLKLDAELCDNARYIDIADQIRDIINNAPTVEQKEFEQVLQPIKVNIPEDIIDKLIEEQSKPRKVILDESKTSADCVIAFDDGFEAAKRLFKRPHGKWKIDGALIACNLCGRIVLKASELYNYCPECGADMRGEDHV